MTSNIGQLTETEVTVFNPDEARMLEALRLRFRNEYDLFNDHALFSARERAYLRFLRWLVRLGHLVPSPTAYRKNQLGGP
jgi:hypothetical protein